MVELPSLERLTLVADSFDARANGDWRVADGAHQSEFQVNLKSNDLGKLMETLNYGAAAAGGKTKVRVEAAWPGAPAEFALETMRGRLHLRSTDGRLPDPDSRGESRRFQPT